MFYLSFHQGWYSRSNAPAILTATPDLIVRESYALKVMIYQRLQSKALAPTHSAKRMKASNENQSDQMEDGTVGQVNGNATSADADADLRLRRSDTSYMGP